MQPKADQPRSLILRTLKSSSAQNVNKQVSNEIFLKNLFNKFQINLYFFPSYEFPFTLYFATNLNTCIFRFIDRKS